MAEDGPLYAAEPVQLSEEELRGATAVGTDEKMLLHFEVSCPPLQAGQISMSIAGGYVLLLMRYFCGGNAASNPHFKVAEIGLLILAF